jgi:hypothetical protein
MTEPTETEEVHFYPGSRIMVYVAGNKVKAIAEAWGGPVTKQPLRPREKMAAGPTTAGKFVIDRMEAYRTDSWQMSKIRWGTPIRGSRTDTRKLEYLSESGKWRPSTIMIEDEVPDPKRKGKVKKVHRLLNTMDVLFLNFHYRHSHEFPDTWLFNDFGPVAVRYYRDRNSNRKRDANEKLSGEMIHTTPLNEGQSDIFKGDFREVELVESHGCIHIRPIDRQTFIDAGAFRQGMTLVVHSYDQIFDPDTYK